MLDNAEILAALRSLERKLDTAEQAALQRHAEVALGLTAIANTLAELEADLFDDDDDPDEDDDEEYVDQGVLERLARAAVEAAGKETAKVTRRKKAGRKR